MKLTAELKSLQERLARLDLLDEQQGQSSDYLGFIVRKLGEIKLRMYQEKKHRKPHLHIDYKKQLHAASFSIKPAHRLIGSVTKRHDKIIIEWIDNHHEKLLEIWEKLQAGELSRDFVESLKGTD